jgi:hypothetical protein
LIEEALNKDRIRNNNKKYINDKIVYTLILRIRTLYIIDKLIKKKNYLKKDFIRLINKVSNGTIAYERYLAVKNNSGIKEIMSIKEIERLYKYLSNQLLEIKRLMKSQQNLNRNYIH